MGYVIGMDEAGYGPNLGPLVVSLSVWRVPGNPHDADFWSTFSPVVTPETTKNPVEIQIADSKQVYSSSRGLKALERGVWCALRTLNQSPSNWTELLHSLINVTRCDPAVEPWFTDADLPIPHEHDPVEGEPAAVIWQSLQRDSGLELVTLRSDLMLTARWNKLCRQFDNKGLALTQTSLELLRTVWNPASQEPTLILADKHGGRNRYAAILSEMFDGKLFQIEEEGQASSAYHCGPHKICFERQAERHLPVALASMISKYLRELSMILFNRFWRRHLPELKPTQGYPEDARRYLAEIQPMQKQLGISSDTLWRER